MGSAMRIGQVGFEAPPSFMGKVFGTSFYFNYLYPVSGEEVDYTKEDALKSKIEQIYAKNSAFQSELCGVFCVAKRIAFACLVLFPAGCLGVIRNSVYTMATLAAYGISRLQKSSEEQLQKGWKRVETFTHALWIDLRLAHLPLLYLVGRKCVHALSAIKVRPQDLPAFTRNVTLLTRLGVVALALDALWQTYKAVCPGEKHKDYLGSAIATHPSEVYGTTLSLILREKLGPQAGAISVLSSQEARAQLAQVYNAYQEEFGKQVFDINKKIYDLNCAQSLALPYTEFFTALSASSVPLTDHKACADLVSQAKETQKKLALCEKMLTPMEMAPLIEAKKDANAVYTGLISTHFGYPNYTNLTEKHKDQIFAAKLWLIDEATTEELVSQISKSWNVGDLIAFFDQITNDNKQGEIEEFKKSLSTIRAELVWLKYVTAVPFLEDLLAHLYPAFGIFNQVRNETKKAFHDSCLTLISQAHTALINQIYLTVYPLLASLNLKPKYHFPSNGTAIANQLEAIVSSGNIQAEATKQQIQNTILTLQSMQRKFKLAQASLGGISKVSFNELRLYEILRTSYNQLIANAEVDLVRDLVKIDNMFNSLQAQQIPCQRFAIDFPFNGSKAIAQMKNILKQIQFNPITTQIFNNLIENIENNQNRIESFRKADSLIQQDPGVRLRPGDDVPPTDIVHRNTAHLKSRVDFASTIEELEAEVATRIGQINLTLKELNAQKVPYACPFDVEQILSNLTKLCSYLSTLKTAKENTVLLSELNEHNYKLLVAGRTLAVFKQLAPMVDNACRNSSQLYMDAAKHKRLYEGDQPPGATTTDFAKAIGTCKLRNSDFENKHSPNYVAFKKRILDCQTKNDPTTNAWTLLGLEKEGATGAALKSAQQKLSKQLHPDKYPTPPPEGSKMSVEAAAFFNAEATQLFQCMNALVAICDAELRAQ